LRTQRWVYCSLGCTVYCRTGCSIHCRDYAGCSAGCTATYVTDWTLLSSGAWGCLYKEAGGPEGKVALCIVSNRVLCVRSSAVEHRVRVHTGYMIRLNYQTACMCVCRCVPSTSSCQTCGP
jgi:hypothetical protein